MKTMKLSLTFLFLQLWGCVDVSLSLTACSTLPEVRHARVSEESKKTEYQEGDVIDFPCELGYRSDQTSKYVCTRAGWQMALQGMCYSCSVTPDVPHGYVTEETRKADYEVGDMIDFACEAGYSSGWTIKYVCSSQGWLRVRQGSCHLSASGCDAYPANDNVTVKGLLGNGNPIPPDHILTFSCDDPGKHLEGSSVLICGKDGQWDNPFPSCKENTCKAAAMHPHLYVAGLPPTNGEMKAGHKLHFQCSNDYKLDGPKEIECLQTGQWNSPFPTCSASSYCGRPPPLEGGDTEEATRDQYNRNNRVKYICQHFYTMEGGPYKTCIDGEWTGDIRCLKPCTLDQDAMSGRNIRFKYSHQNKLYSTHNDEIEFLCTKGSVVGGVRMRQRCLHGVIELPTCE